MRVVLPPHIANHPGLIGSYRPNAAAVIVDDQGRLLWCERVSPPGVWQFPQGGIDPGETPEQAMWRELHEELGLESPRRWLSIVASLEAPVCYDFPVDVISAFLEAGRPSYIGQAQHVFLLRWSGHDGLLTLDPPPGEAREFTRFQWGGLEMLEHTSPFKREATLEALEALELL